jgi:hypothetical protein
MDARIKEKINCCGSNFESNQVSTFGLITLSLPLIYIGLLLTPLLFLLRFVPGLSKFGRKLKIILTANLQLIGKQRILPEARCNTAVFFDKISDNLSSMAYNNFNVLTLSLFWMIPLSGVLLLV